MPSDTIVWSQAGLTELFESEEGVVAKDLARRAERVRGEAVRNCPVDTGRLRSSIRWAFAKEGSQLVAMVGSDVEYALFVHEGTQPHFPPLSALSVWAARHGFESPYLVGRAIATHGTEPNRFLIDALPAAAE
jgi:hypothetical protein